LLLLLHVSNLLVLLGIRLLLLCGFLGAMVTSRICCSSDYSGPYDSSSSHSSSHHDWFSPSSFCYSVRPGLLKQQQACRTLIGNAGWSLLEQTW